ncbi:MAG: NUDIX domain-containing protein [Chloroflexota bacterium]|nr:NUDIX domain-containing protein [Chloroflexota bacterium]
MDDAQDPAELFDVVLADGTPTGRTKPRTAVHRDGDWHRAVHVWVAGHDERGDPFLLFQRRSLAKDTFPGCLDATVGGHYRAGEQLAQAIREVEEEIGIVPDLAALRPLGVRICASEQEPGIIDRELQDIFLLIDNGPLTAYRPHPAELAGLVRFRLADLLPLLAGEASSLSGAVLTVGSDQISEQLFGVADFVIRLDRYFYRVAIAVTNALRGDTHVAV